MYKVKWTLKLYLKEIKVNTHIYIKYYVIGVTFILCNRF